MMKFMQWNRNNTGEAFLLWSQCPKTHAVGLDLGALRIRQKDSQPLDTSTFEFPPPGSFLWATDDGFIDWAPWSQ